MSQKASVRSVASKSARIASDTRRKKETARFSSYQEMCTWATWTIIQRLIAGDLEGGVHLVVQSVRHPNAL